MHPTGHIDPRPWMTASETRRVVAALAAEGADVRFVGGCVRDTLAGRKVADIDIATPDPPDGVVDLLRRAGIKAVPTGIAHGTITAVCDRRSFEVTTLRRDVETFGRHARVAFTDDWEADAARRDFTFNAMSCRPDGTLFDPFGGTADLAAGRVRFVGDPTERLREDVLRLLRFFRFYAHYGRPPPDPASLAACSAAAPRLDRLSGERIRAELLRLLAAPDPGTATRLMATAGVLDHLLPEAARLDRLAALVAVETAHDLPVAPIRRLAALLSVDAAGAAALAARLRLSNKEAARLGGMVRRPPAATLGTDPRSIRRALFDLGRERHRDLAVLAAAESPAEARHLTLRLSTAAGWTPPRLPVGGADALAAGVPRGPAVGRALAAVADWWREEDFAPDRDACLARLAAVIGQPNIHVTGNDR